MRKLMMLAGTIVLLSLLATSPAFAQTNDVCDNPFRELPLDGRTACVKPGACPGNAPARAEEFGQGNDRVCAFFIGEDRIFDRDFFDRDFFDRDVVDVVPVISQDIEQEAESGDITQNFDVSQTGDNSNQTVGIQGTANTGNVQNVIDVVDAGDFVGDFDDNNEFIDDEDVICFEDENGDNIDDLNGVICFDEEDSIFGDGIFDDGIIDDAIVCFDDFGNRINTNDERCIIVDDGDFGDFGDFDDGLVLDGDNGIDELEFEEVGSSITMSPEQTVTGNNVINQAAAASGDDDDCVPVWDPWWQTWVCLPT